MPLLPRLPGTYVLHLILEQPCALDVGRLCRHSFSAGHYLYLGSARGPGGLRARLARHIAGTGKFHWHIDHLRAHAQIKGIHYSVESSQAISSLVMPLECLWSQALVALPNVCAPVPGFGAGDCTAKCPAHLVAFANEVEMNLAEVLAQALVGRGAYSQVHRYLDVHSRSSIPAGQPPEENEKILK